MPKKRDQTQRQKAGGARVRSPRTGGGRGGERNLSTLGGKRGEIHRPNNKHGWFASLKKAKGKILPAAGKKGKGEISISEGGRAAPARKEKGPTTMFFPRTLRRGGGVRPQQERGRAGVGEKSPPSTRRKKEEKRTPGNTSKLG